MKMEMFSYRAGWVVGGPAATRVEGAIGKVDKVIYIST
jgi:hypothetical protein